LSVRERNSSPVIAPATLTVHLVAVLSTLANVLQFSLPMNVEKVVVSAKLSQMMERGTHLTLTTQTQQTKKMQMPMQMQTLMLMRTLTQKRTQISLPVHNSLLANAPVTPTVHLVAALSTLVDVPLLSLPLNVEKVVVSVMPKPTMEPVTHSLLMLPTKKTLMLMLMLMLKQKP